MRRTVLRLVSLLLAQTLACTVAHAASDRYVEYADEVPATPRTKTVIVDRVQGTGPETRRAQFVVIDYEAWVFDPSAPDMKGLKFDSTKDRGYPLSVLLGVNRMIPGMDRGIAGMRAGGRRTLVIPPRMGYGDRKAFGIVPPNSTLIFDIELHDVVPERNVD